MRVDPARSHARWRRAGADRLCRVEDAPVARLILAGWLLTMAGCGGERKAKPDADPWPLESMAEVSTNEGGKGASAKDLLNRAIMARGQGKIDEALYFFIKTLELERDQPIALLGVAAIHRERGNLDLAEVAYRLVLKKSDRNVEALEGLGLILVQQQRDKQAANLLNAAIRLDPNRWQAYNGLGLLADKAGNPQQATGYYEKARRIRPRDPQILNNLGFARFQAGDQGGALRAYDEATMIDPRYEPAWLNKGLLFARLGNDKGAIEAFRQIMSEADAYNDLGYLHMKAGNVDAAYACFEKAISLSPSYHQRANENLLKLKLMSDHQQ